MKVIDTVRDKSKEAVFGRTDCFVKYLDTVQISPLLFCVKCPMCPLLSACQGGEHCEPPGTCPAQNLFLPEGEYLAINVLQGVSADTYSKANYYKCVSLHWITKDVIVSQAPTQHAGLAKYDTVSLCSHSSLLLDRGVRFHWLCHGVAILHCGS